MSAGRVDIDEVRQSLAQLGLHFAVEALPEMVTEAVKSSQPPHQLLGRLLRSELEQREERRVKTGLRLSGLPPGKTLGGFDFSFQPSVERSRIETLATWKVGAAYRFGDLRLRAAARDHSDSGAARRRQDASVRRPRGEGSG